jgi:hypothetical protein
MTPLSSLVFSPPVFSPFILIRMAWQNRSFYSLLRAVLQRVRKTDSLSDRYTDRQADRQTDRQTYRYTDRQIH